MVLARVELGEPGRGERWGEVLRPLMVWREAATHSGTSLVEGLCGLFPLCCAASGRPGHCDFAQGSWD